MKGLLLIVSGPSGTGKGTICKEVVAKTQVELSVSATTRSPRACEVHGRDYFFLSEEEFIEIIEKDGFIEHVENFGKRYGTPEFFVREKLAEGKDMILEIDVQGAEKVKRKFPECVLIFVMPPSLEELRSRIVARGTESDESICIRMGKAMQEVECVKQYDYCIINDKIDKAVNDMISIIHAEHNKVREDVNQLIKRFKEAQDALS